jgi:hypothetical protein
MSNPTLGAVHVSRPLTNISIAYRQENNSFIADRVFPIVSVGKQADKYFTYDRSYWFRSGVQLRAPGTESAGSDYKISTDTYSCDVYALHKDIADQIRANEDTPLNSDRDATEWLTLQAMIKKEIDFASTYMATNNTVWTFRADGVASSPTAPASFDPTNLASNDILHWSDASSTPIEDVRRGKTYVLEKTGYRPNTLTMSERVVDALLDHPDIVDRIKYGQTAGGPAMANNQILAQLFGVDEVLVSAAVQNTAAEGASESNSFVVGKHALLSYKPRTPSILVPSAGYTFGWTGYLGGNVGAFQISKFRMDHLKSDRVEGEMAYDQKLVAADLGYFFNGIVA